MGKLAKKGSDQKKKKNKEGGNRGEKGERSLTCICLRLVVVGGSPVTSVQKGSEKLRQGTVSKYTNKEGRKQPREDLN